MDMYDRSRHKGLTARGAKVHVILILEYDEISGAYFDPNIRMSKEQNEDIRAEGLKNAGFY